jgi:nucleoside phosphorylase
MEGAALAKVAHDYTIPLIILKIISDHADESAGEDFETNLLAGERVVKHLPFLLEFLMNQ